MQLAAADWEPEAQQTFMQESSTASLQRALSAASYAAGAFSGGEMAGFLLMPKPVLLAMLFVDPRYLRRGIGRALWESARGFIEARFADATTVEVNSTPYAVEFYRAIGFMPISREFVNKGCRATRMACWLPGRRLAQR